MEHANPYLEALGSIDLESLRRDLRGKAYRDLIQALVRHDPSGERASLGLAASLSAFNEEQLKKVEYVVTLLRNSGLPSRFLRDGPPSVIDDALSDVLGKKLDVQQRAFWTRDASEVLDAVEVHLQLALGDGARSWDAPLVFTLFQVLNFSFALPACKEKAVREFMGIRLGLFSR